MAVQNRGHGSLPKDVGQRIPRRCPGPLDGEERAFKFLQNFVEARPPKPNQGGPDFGFGTTGQFMDRSDIAGVLALIGG
jgi:hypothetical protein